MCLIKCGDLKRQPETIDQVNAEMNLDVAIGMYEESKKRVKQILNNIEGPDGIGSFLVAKETGKESELELLRRSSKNEKSTNNAHKTSGKIRKENPDSPLY